MNLQEFIALVPKFSDLSHPEKVKHFGWYLHSQKKVERFNQGDIKRCYVDADLEPPNLTKEFGRLQDRSPRELLKDTLGYRLEHKARSLLTQRYGGDATNIAISQLLKGLPGKISNDAERLFLSEALKCYQVEAFRAVIVMTWNLAYDHVLNWLLRDSARLAAFNSKIAARVNTRKGIIQIAHREDFEDLKEAEVLDICGLADLFASDNIKKILQIQLVKRNLAAHPSLIEIDRPTADDTIFSLVTNVVLKLA